MTTSDTAPVTLVKPTLRGVSHEIAFFAVLILGPPLVVAATGTSVSFATAVYATSMAAMFGCSALLHRGTWSARVLPWMRRLDHSMIFVFIAGTYTPVLVSASLGSSGGWLLVTVWSGAVIGVLITLFWLDAPRWVTSVCYLAVGWVALGAMPQLWSALSSAQFALLVAGGVLFSLGAVVYARKRPDPVPTVFGYHEVFHALVIVAVVAHFVLIASLVST